LENKTPQIVSHKKEPENLSEINKPKVEFENQKQNNWFESGIRRILSEIQRNNDDPVKVHQNLTQSEILRILSELVNQKQAMKVKRNDHGEEKLNCQKSSENENLLKSHFDVESIQSRLKHCSNYFSKFGKIFPDEMIPSESETTELPALAFVHEIGSVYELIEFESMKYLIINIFIT